VPNCGNEDITEKVVLIIITGNFSKTVKNSKSSSFPILTKIFSGKHI